MGGQEVQKPSLDVHYSEQNTTVDNLKFAVISAET
jgi:hypothetical protein